MDKSALGWEHVEKVEKHESQKGMTRHLDAPITYLNVNIFLVSSLIYNSLLLLFFTDYKSGFGGSFGVQNDRQDKSAVGWEHIEKVEKHESQKGKNI